MSRIDLGRIIGVLFSAKLLLSRDKIIFRGFYGLFCADWWRRQVVVCRDFQRQDRRELRSFEKRNAVPICEPALIQSGSLSERLSGFIIVDAD